MNPRKLTPSQAELVKDLIFDAMLAKDSQRLMQAAFPEIAENYKELQKQALNHARLVARYFKYANFNR